MLKGLNSSMMLYFLLFLALYMTYLNFRMVRRNKNSSGYVACANALFKGDSDAGKKIDEYLEKEKVEEYRQKTAIFKMYQQLRDEEDCTETLQNFEPAVMLTRKGVLDPKAVITNSDSFVWASILLNKAGALGNTEFNRAFLEKFAPYKEELKQFVEYKVMECTADLYTSENEDWKTFCRNLLAGEYEGYRYEKKLIGFFKRIAQLLLAEGGEELDEQAQEDLTAFATSSVGKMMMNDRGVYPKYAAPVEEEESEENPEGNEEAEETPAEETPEEEIPVEEALEEETAEDNTEAAEEPEAEEGSEPEAAEEEVSEEISETVPETEENEKNLPETGTEETKEEE